MENNLLSLQKELQQMQKYQLIILDMANYNEVLEPNII
jgi:hypothetical protein